MTTTVLPGTRLRRGRKVTAKERPVHDAFGAQMRAGTIRAWWAYEADEWEIEEMDGTRVMLSFRDAAARAGVTVGARKVSAVKATKDELADMLRQLATYAPDDVRERALDMVAA